MYKYILNSKELSSDKMFKLYRKVVDNISHQQNFIKLDNQLRKDILNAFRIDIMKKNGFDIKGYRCNICFKPLQLKYDKEKDIYVPFSSIVFNKKRKINEEYINSILSPILTNEVSL